MAEIVPLHAYTPEFEAAFQTFLNHYAECPQCEDVDEQRHRVRVCSEGRSLWHRTVDTLAPERQLAISLLFSVRLARRKEDSNPPSTGVGRKAGPRLPQSEDEEN